jgi:hypothetical protein
MIQPLLQSHLEPVARRLRRLRLLRAFSWFWLGATLAGAAVVVIGRLLQLPPLFLIAGVFTVGGMVALIVHQRLNRWSPDYRQIARDIEANHPDLHALLLTAVEQRPDPQTGHLNFLQQRVIDQALEETRRRQIIDTVAPDELAKAESRTFAVLLLFLLSVTLGAFLIPDRQRDAGAFADAKVSVTPGDITLERGSGLVVLARFDGPLPSEATLVVQSANRDAERIPLSKTLDDPVFGGSITEVSGDLLYSIEFAGQRTRDFKVKVFDYPRLEKADARLTFPDYTGLPEKNIADTRRVSAVEGSKLDLALHLNKSVVAASLVARDKSRIDLTVDTNAPSVRLSDFDLITAKNYELQLRDAEGRTNKIPALFTFDVLKNRAPELKLLAPRGDQRVSPLQEIAFEAEAWDDFGLRGLGLTYTVAGSEPKSIPIVSITTNAEKRQFKYMLRLEDLGVAPEQLVSWHLWADDVGPEGNERRTSGDMFFAEVRAFEEIYREDESGGGGGGGGGGQAAAESFKLAEVQKQIINATWKLQRRQEGQKPSDPYKKDLTVVQESQQKALDQAEALKLKASDPRVHTLLQAVNDFMEKALDHLKDSGDKTESLVPALGSEQSAYQALLKLASREHLVTRGRQQQGGGGGGGQANRQQLDQLELKQEERRYETQRQATRQQSPEQKEQLAVLNRLKELAQRQNDLNERIKELQTALQEARTEAEKEELRRRLKRLREEERELLADVDQLGERMQQPANQSNMSEAREQLEQTRSEVQRAAEALENANPSQALASGARAQQELEQLRDDFRKKNSSKFAEDMRDMRSDARELAEKESKISEKLQEQANNKRKSLSQSEDMKELVEQLQSQRTGLTNLLEHMRAVSEQAESSEPLLSKQLYDTFRKSNQGNLQDSLNLTEELLKRSFLSEAGQFEQRARKEIDELKQGVEQAAESVLGDEAEALRMAKSELEELAQQVQRELAAQAGRGATNAVAQGRSPSQERSASQEQGQETAGQQPGNGQQQQGQRQGESGQDRQQGQSGRENQQGQANAGQNQSGQGQSQSQNQTGEGQSQQNQTGNNQGGQSPSERQASNRDGQGGGRNRNFFERDLNNSGGGPDGGGDGLNGPLTGERYGNWSERLGNVEEMLDSPEMRRELARIRDRARNFRAEFKRHSKEPQWDLVQTQILKPLTEVRNRVTEELRRHESAEALVPIDRDPVPAKFSELVRRYYEKLGSE